MRTGFVLLIIGIGINQGLAIRCYRCTTTTEGSTEKEGCADSFTGQLDNTVFWADCNLGCEKRVLHRAENEPLPGEWFEENVYQIQRGCATSKREIGCSKTPKRFYQNKYLWTEVCFCEGIDGCNSANGQTFNVLISSVLAMVTYIIGFLYT